MLPIDQSPSIGTNSYKRWGLRSSRGPYSYEHVDHQRRPLLVNCYAKVFENTAPDLFHFFFIAKIFNRSHVGYENRILWSEAQRFDNELTQKIRVLRDSLSARECNRNP